MRNRYRRFDRSYAAFKQATAQWEVLKTTDAYTQLLQAHADLSKAYADLSVWVAGMIVISALITLIVGVFTWISR